MRYINLRLTYLLTYSSLKYGVVFRLLLNTSPETGNMVCNKIIKW